jgi:hypothetical protein
MASGQLLGYGVEITGSPCYYQNECIDIDVPYGIPARPEHVAGEHICPSKL